MGRIVVVGVGPGCEDYITPKAKRAVEEAEILIGGRRQLALFPAKKEVFEISGHVEKVLSFIEKNRDRKIAVLASGDPGFYSILRPLLEKILKRDIEIIPGISAMQVSFARAKLSWHDATFFSVHGRSVEGLVEKVNGSKKLALLTDNKRTPDDIASLLLKEGVKGKHVVVCEALCEPGERIVEGSLEDIAKQSFSGNSVMVIYDER